MQKFFGEITKIGELKTGVWADRPWTMIEFEMTNKSIDGSSETAKFVASGSLAESINDLRAIVEDKEKKSFAGVYMADYKHNCRQVTSRDGSTFDVIELKLISLSRIF